MKRRHRFTVYIHKVYFPEATRSTVLFTEAQERWTVLAWTRTEAAQAIWAEHGARLIPLIRPEVGIVSLHVSGLLRTCNAGRMPPIRVWVREK